jgi:hypothetical protein
MIATGVMRIGGESWAAEGARENPEVLVKRTFAAIRGDPRLIAGIKRVRTVAAGWPSARPP